MKIFFSAILFFLLFCNPTYSQTQQGKFVFSGGTNIRLLFSNLDPNTDDVVDNRTKEQNYTVNAGLGYFIIDNLAIGITSSYQYSYTKKQLYLGSIPGDDNPIYDENIQNGITVIPSVTYFFPVEGIVKPNISLGAGYVNMKEKSNQSTTPGNIIYHYDGLSLNAGAGVSIFLNKSVSFDLGFQYSRNKLNYKTDGSLSQLQHLYGAIGGVSVYF